MRASSRITAPWWSSVSSGNVHMVDERVAVADLETLTRIYETFIERWFGHAATE